MDLLFHVRYYGDMRRVLDSAIEGFKTCYIDPRGFVGGPCYKELEEAKLSATSTIESTPATPTPHTPATTAANTATPATIAARAAATAAATLPTINGTSKFDYMSLRDLAADPEDEAWAQTGAAAFVTNIIDGLNDRIPNDPMMQAFEDIFDFTLMPTTQQEWDAAIEVTDTYTDRQG